MGIKIDFVSVYHPEANDTVERSNRIIFKAVKKNLMNQAKGRWPEEVAKVVWSHNTAVSRTTGFIPFKLLYGEEAVMPEEIRLEGPRTTQPFDSQAEATVKDTLEIQRMQAANNLATYQNKTQTWKDKGLSPKGLKVGDWVLLRTPRTEQRGKLESKWDGLYIINANVRLGAYRLADIEGRQLQHSWNEANLRKFYN